MLLFISAKCLEAVSKPIECNDEACDVEEGPVDVEAVFIAHHEASEVAQPCHRPLDHPAAAVSPEFATIGGLAVVTAIRSDQIDAAI